LPAGRIQLSPGSHLAVTVECVGRILSKPIKQTFRRHKTLLVELKVPEILLFTQLQHIATILRLSTFVIVKNVPSEILGFFSLTASTFI